MGKKKLQRFEEMKAFERVFQPSFNEIFSRDHDLKGRWKQLVFKNNNPLILELGCGKGEYTTGLAKMFPLKNFIGVDIKGARIWKGAKAINEENITNAAFLRTKIEFVFRFFEKDEIDEIWLTFPDPQPKKRKRKKRLCSTEFLKVYQKFLKNNGVIHLKTDSPELYQYATSVINKNNLEILLNTEDLYASDIHNEITAIRTYYETIFLNEGKSIFYLQFRLPADKTLEEIDIDSDYEK